MGKTGVRGGRERRGAPRRREGERRTDELESPENATTRGEISVATGNTKFLSRRRPRRRVTGFREREQVRSLRGRAIRDLYGPRRSPPYLSRLLSSPPPKPTPCAVQ